MPDDRIARFVQVWAPKPWLSPTTSASCVSPATRVRSASASPSGRHLPEDLLWLAAARARSSSLGSRTAPCWRAPWQHRSLVPGLASRHPRSLARPGTPHHRSVQTCAGHPYLVVLASRTHDHPRNGPAVANRPSRVLHTGRL